VSRSRSVTISHEVARRSAAAVQGGKEVDSFGDSDTQQLIME